MSILIKGIEMPKHAVGVLIQPDGTVLDYRYGTPVGQAIPIPPHGDLIDIDRALNGLPELYDKHDLEDVVAAAPTIIEAEE